MGGVKKGQNLDYVIFEWSLAKTALNASATFDEGACAGDKVLLPTILLWSKLPASKVLDMTVKAI